MKKIQIILIGKKSFIAYYLHKMLKKKIRITHLSLEKFMKMNLNNVSKYSFICNCAINHKYQLKVYKKENDIDLKIINKIKNINIKYIFLSSRKVYKPGPNLKESSTILPQDNYSKNKLITENLVKQYKPKKYIILRISNLVGTPIKNSRKVSKNFIDNFVFYFKNKKKIKYKNYFKDFLSINQFIYIFHKVLKKNITGTFNLSLGEKVFIKEILQWLDKNNLNKFIAVNKFTNNDSFYLNNEKIKKKLNIQIKKNDLRKYCLYNFKII
jgi:dTDP-4-dehydrorhamnose reductase|tara:strand:+ start:182 stop:988 length:807 start_codon:yes stop_codon:yes gene_type:complete